MSIRQLSTQTSIGQLHLVASPEGLRGIFWVRQDVPDVGDNGGAAAVHLRAAAQQIEDFLGGRRKDFDLVTDICGTPFQMRVWAELSKIPYGETRSYKDIAAAVGTPRACRAVGTANGRNPICLIVPCHRVIAADGTLGGYAGGLRIKESLLKLESAVIRS